MADSELRQRRSEKSNVINDDRTKKIEVNLEVDGTIWFYLAKGLLTAIIFIILYTLYYKFIFQPLFHANVDVDFSSVAPQLCPKGAEDCSYTLSDDWKERVRQSLK
eukprot:TRINITY_DN951_c0_g1_i1.p1 TRINITY_DN951_c0_g1~~TRINITY_DN951_c0_g1_i1.p1  ORF type:complete len:106 (+),score=21.44 TRINITY_DN951_c0_g1_i1:90-407(+)